MRLLPIAIVLALVLCACRVASHVDRTMQRCAGDVPGASVLARRAATPATN
jgi:hypothetical protein